MAKTAKKSRPLSGAELDLNRWCIEMAMRWPVHTQASYGAAGSAYGHPIPKPDVHQDEDVIGRANQIIAWVKTQH